MSQTRIPAVFMRGGTSKAVVVKRADLPKNEALWPALFSAMLGSPDPSKRQLDGLGGGLSSVSKVCIVGPASREDVDIDYTFAQIGVVDDSVDFSGNCGNMSSAMGPFAYDEGLVRGPRDGEAEVRIHNTNTGKVIVARFAVTGGEAMATGSASIPGVTGSGAPVMLDFLDPGGTSGRGLLPSGKAVETITLSDGRQVRVTMIDAANTCVFVTAADLDADTSAHPEALDADAPLMITLEEIRQRASIAMGLAPDRASAARRMGTPKIAVVGPPGPCTDLAGAEYGPDSHDLQIRMISAGQAHRAVPVTGALALACAAALPNSIPSACLGTSGDATELRIATPSGVVTVGAARDAVSGRIIAASILRTQRRLMEGNILVPQVFQFS